MSDFDDAMTIPCDPTLLAPLGRVAWAAQRLQAGVRDAINAPDGDASDKPFGVALGVAINELRTKALSKAGEPDRTALVGWCDTEGHEATERRNGVLHAVAYTGPDGRQAIGGAGPERPQRYLEADLLGVAGALVAASRSLPRGPYRIGEEVMSTPTAPFVPEPARRGLDRLDRALSRWSSFLDQHPPKPLPSEEIAAELRAEANGHAVEVVRWIRSLDDYLAGQDTDQEPASGYEAGRAADSEIGDLLDGIAHAANKSLHLLVDVVAGPPPIDLISQSSFGAPPPPQRRGDVPVYRWPDLSQLPQRTGRRAQKLQAAYDAHLARGPVDFALQRATHWLRARRP